MLSEWCKVFGIINTKRKLWKFLLNFVVSAVPAGGLAPFNDSDDQVSIPYIQGTSIEGGTHQDPQTLSRKKNVIIPGHTYHQE